MNKTKEAILNEALKMFNEEGLSEVSLRGIANNLNISVGNLQYHFKKREDLIEMLYFNMVMEIDSYYLVKDESSSSLESLLRTLQFISEETLFKYRFIVFDFVQIIRSNTNVRAHHNEMKGRRKQGFMNMLETICAEGMLREEELPNEYEGLFTRLHIVLNFWMYLAIGDANKKLTKKVAREFTPTIWQSIYPLLTEKGEKEYRRVLNELSD